MASATAVAETLERRSQAPRVRSGHPRWHRPVEPFGQPAASDHGRRRWWLVDEDTVRTARWPTTSWGSPRGVGRSPSTDGTHRAPPFALDARSDAYDAHARTIAVRSPVRMSGSRCPSPLSKRSVSPGTAASHSSASAALTNESSSPCQSVPGHRFDGCSHRDREARGRHPFGPPCACFLKRQGCLRGARRVLCVDWLQPPS